MYLSLGLPSHLGLPQLVSDRSLLSQAVRLLPVLILAFPGTRIDSTLVLCLCGQAADLVPPSYFALPRGTSGLRLAVKLFQLVPSGLRVARLKSYIKRDSSSLVKVLAIWVAFASPEAPNISHSVPHYLSWAVCPDRWCFLCDGRAGGNIRHSL